MKRLVRWLRRRRPPADDRPLGLLREGDFVAIDFETTGLDPQRDVPVSVAAVPFQRGKPVLGFETLLNPGRPIPVASTLIHGINDTMVAAAPRLDDVLDQLDAVCADRVLVGHGIAFDLAVLARARRDCRRPPLGNAALCTMRLAVICARVLPAAVPLCWRRHASRWPLRPWTLPSWAPPCCHVTGSTGPCSTCSSFTRHGIAVASPRHSSLAL